MGQQFFVNEDHKSIGVFLAGSIEYWWDRPDDPNRFMSPAAVEYREWREILSKWFTDNGFLVYRPHEAFKGPWDEKMQQVNDLAITLCHIFVEMTPVGISLGKGTSRELSLASDLNRSIIWMPPGINDDTRNVLLEGGLRRARLKRILV